MIEALRFIPEAERFSSVAADLLRQRLGNGALVGLPGDGVVAARVKSPAAIIQKVERRGIEDRDAISKINDFVGLRVLVLHVGFLTVAVDVVRSWAERIPLSTTSTDDRFASPSSGGYRAIHLGFELPAANEWNLPEGASVEVQITTWLQHFHGVISHQQLYKPANQAGSEASPYLMRLSDQLNEIDNRLARWTKARGVAEEVGENKPRK